MYVNFEYRNGANPYIATTNLEIFHMFCKYDVMRLSNTSFMVLNQREWNGKPRFEGKKELLRNMAIDFQSWLGEHDISMNELNEWECFFSEMGKQYCLIREFKHNGII